MELFQKYGTNHRNSNIALYGINTDGIPFYRRESVVTSIHENVQQQIAIGCSKDKSKLKFLVLGYLSGFGKSRLLVEFFESCIRNNIFYVPIYITFNSITSLNRHDTFPECFIGWRVLYSYLSPTVSWTNFMKYLMSLNVEFDLEIIIEFIIRDICAIRNCSREMISVVLLIDEFQRPKGDMFKALMDTLVALMFSTTVNVVPVLAGLYMSFIYEYSEQSFINVARIVMPPLTIDDGFKIAAHMASKYPIMQQQLDPNSNQHLQWIICRCHAVPRILELILDRCVKSRVQIDEELYRTFISSHHSDLKMQLRNHIFYATWLVELVSYSLLSLIS